MTSIDYNLDYSKLRGSTELHNEFKKKFMVAVSREFRNVVVIPYDVGFFRAWSNPDIPVRCGMDGVPDTIILGLGWYLLLDMKTGRATLQENQKKFQKRIKDINAGRDRVFKIKSINQGLKLIRSQYSE